MILFDENYRRYCHLKRVEITYGMSWPLTQQVIMRLNSL